MKYKRYWEMRSPNPFSPGGSEEMFKCTQCGAESFPDNGWDGAPDTHRCSHDCRLDHSGLRLGITNEFMVNIGRINWAGHKVKPKEIRKALGRTVYVF